MKGNTGKGPQKYDGKKNMRAKEKTLRAPTKGTPPARKKLT